MYQHISIHAFNHYISLYPSIHRFIHLLIILATYLWFHLYTHSFTYLHPRSVLFTHLVHYTHLFTNPPATLQSSIYSSVSILIQPHLYTYSVLYTQPPSIANHQSTHHKNKSFKLHSLFKNLFYWKQGSKCQTGFESKPSFSLHCKSISQTCSCN